MQKQWSRRFLGAMLFGLSCCAALIASAGVRAAEPAVGRHQLILISIDGLRPDFYRDSSWPAPNLQALARRGVSADGVRGVFPTLTYPSHTTLVTGVDPAVHGIVANTLFDLRRGSTEWHIDARKTWGSGLAFDHF